MRLLAIGYLLSVVLTATARAQDPPRTLATRADLQNELARLGTDPAAAVIRARLESGDFQVGDRIFVRVEGDSVLSDTFTVIEGLELPLPQLGAVSLRGVLRSELQDKIGAYLSQYLRDVRLEVRPLMRILVEGQVQKPGFVAARPEQPLADVISGAGGFTQQAKVTDMRLERGQTTILTGSKLQQALGQGYSLDRLSLRAGDRIFVPQRGDSERTLRIVGLILSVPVGILALTKVF